MDGEREELSETAPGHYRQEYIRCGKTRCKRCNPPAGTPATGHGPYWYRYVWLGGKQRKRYVGKDLPEHVQTRLELVPGGSASSATTATAPDPATAESTETLPKTPETGTVLGVEPEPQRRAAAANESATTTPKTPIPKTRAAKRKPKPKPRIDPDTVRLERGELGRWRALAGSTLDPIVVGYIDPVSGTAGRRKGWQALSDTLLPIPPRRSCKTRQDALVRVVEYYMNR